MFGILYLYMCVCVCRIYTGLYYTCSTCVGYTSVLHMWNVITCVLHICIIGVWITCVIHLKHHVLHLHLCHIYIINTDTHSKPNWPGISFFFTVTWKKHAMEFIVTRDVNWEHCIIIKPIWTCLDAIFSIIGNLEALGWWNCGNFKCCLYRQNIILYFAELMFACLFWGRGSQALWNCSGLYRPCRLMGWWV